MYICQRFSDPRMEFLRLLPRKCVDQHLQKYSRHLTFRINHHASSKYINRQLHTINTCESNQIQGINQNGKTLGFLKPVGRLYSTDGNDDPDKPRKQKIQSPQDYNTSTEEKGTSNDECPSSSDEYSSDDEAYAYEQLQGGLRVKHLLEEAQSQRLNDEFDFEGSAEDEIAIAKKRTYIDPKNMTVFLFPGQGTQTVGMGKALLSYPNVKDMFDIASDILGYDLLSLCLNGPQDKLNQTVHCQPAVVITSLAAVEKLKVESPEIVENCVATAGFSVGEFTALVFSGALTFEEAVYLIKVRAEAMQLASDQVDSGMLSVISREQTNYKAACREAVEYCRNEEGIVDPVCAIANYMFPGARVIAGHTTALNFLQKNLKKFSFRSAKKIPVSGAFHTDLMKPAQESIAEALAEVNFEVPAISVHSNVDGKIYRHAKHIRKQLKSQVVKPVKWEQSMHEIYQRKSTDSFPMTVEVGPGSQLITILKRINFKAAKTFKNIDI
ncbi:malonyl-CoA-acyl carrier protein transacylase, mitochondrial-like isoform X2 [Anneissia japonica]|uniref:malonyl-CoA-acyl carrier protein transacylase, mitochondrial-like isoform X2 n=1 Tax=Anneissia japonica TaxID=1529436 RepID=UPI0014255F0E|nr:malonyl-CoA-acyl carrier protein transacylase, mitochondrial-like isoform X2 [Anneissia japonica]